MLVQFVGQIVGLVLLRRDRPDMPRPYKMWFYPVPAALALLGWLFIFVTSAGLIVLTSLGLLGLGIVSFLVWSKLKSSPEMGQ